MRILILGAGAVGGYFGGRLAQTGVDVTFLARPERRRRLEASGLVIKSPLGDATLAPTLLSAGETAAPFDLVILACKAYDLDDAIRAVAPYVGDKTLLLPLLNGFAHIGILRSHFGAARVLGGFAEIGATLGANGEIIHFNALNRIGFGAPGGPAPPVLETLAHAFAQTPAQVVFSGEIAALMWGKYVFLATLAAATCLMRASIGVILQTPAGPELIAALLDEALRIAEAAGYPPDAERVAGYRAFLFDPESNSTASMLRDMLRGGKTENAHILGRLLETAKAFKIDAPSLALAHSHILAYEIGVAAQG